MSNTNTDESVVVIGAGIIGIACAHYLAADGRKVIVLDKGAIAGGCSHGNCGHVIPSHVLPLNSPGAMKAAILSLFDRAAPFRVKPQLKPSFLWWMMQFARYCTNARMLEGARCLKTILDSSFDEFESLLKEGVFSCDWKKSGLLYLYQSQRAFDDFAKTDALLTERFGVSAQPITGEELPGFDPAIKSGLAGGFFYQNDALLRPDMLARTWAATLRERGVEFVEYCDVHGFQKEGQRIKSVKTSKAAFCADHIVLAAGALSGALAKEFDCAIPVIPGKGYSVTVSRPARSPKTSVVLPERNVAITPFDDGLRFGSMMEFVGYDNTIPAYRVRQLKESATSYLHSAVPTGHEEEWFGWRPMTWDSLPIISRTPKLSNAVVATGHGMLGVMLAPGTGRLTAEILGERPRHIPDQPFSLARFAN